MKLRLKAAAESLDLQVPDLKSGKSLEALLLFRLALSIRSAGHDVVAVDHQGSKVTTFVLRGAPGCVAASADPHPQPSCFVIDRAEPDWSLELHNSLEFAGASGTHHEIDIALVRATDVNVVRGEGGGPLRVAPLIGAELKEHDPGKALAKSLVRAFIACVVDLSPLRHIRYVGVGTALPARDISLRHPYSDYWFVTTAVLTPESMKLARFFGIKPVSGLGAPEIRDLESRVLEVIVFVHRPTSG